MFQVQDPFVRQDPAYGVRRLCAFVQPVKRLLAIELDRSRNSKGIVRADLLDEFTISWCTGIGYYDEIKWSFLRPVALQSDFNWHLK